jgi:hypothetical protein
MWNIFDAENLFSWGTFIQGEDISVEGLSSQASVFTSELLNTEPLIKLAAGNSHYKYLY